MNWLVSDRHVLWALVKKDWQVYRKQLAGYLGGMLLALGLVGSGAGMAAAAGALLLLVLLVVVGSYSISSTVLGERKQQNVPFVMSLPVTPMDVYWGKLLANLLIYLVPLGMVAGGMVVLILTTALPDGLVVWTLLIAGFVLATFCISLCAAIALQSEGWNIFVMLALMTMMGPFIYWVGQLDGVGNHMQGEHVIWSGNALLVFAGELVAVALAIVATSVKHARKTSFL